MLEYRQILGTNCADFAAVWSLYCAAFPAEERRSLAYQQQTFARGEYICEAVFDTVKGCFVGFVMWWDFSDFRYVEHFAVDSTLRGGGYGTRVLADFMGRDSRVVYLEVEPPTDELKQRRIEFYQRSGFVLNPHPYAQPPLDPAGTEFLDLLVMTSGAGVSLQQIEHFKAVTFPVVHFGYYDRQK